MLLYCSISQVKYHQWRYFDFQKWQDIHKYLQDEKMLQMKKCTVCKQDVAISFDYEECDLCLTELLWDLLMGGIDKEGDFSDKETFEITSDFALELLQRRHGKRLDERESIGSEEDRERERKESEFKRKRAWILMSPYWDAFRKQ